MWQFTYRAVLAIAGLFGAAGVATAGTVTFDNSIESRVLEKPVSYAMYLPPGYDTDRRAYPVIYLLHGGGTGQPSDWFTLAKIDQLLDGMIADGDIPPVIAVAPDGRRDYKNAVATYFMDDADGRSRWEQMFTTEFMPAVEMRYRALASPQDRVIMGISMGGVAAVHYQLRHPERWAGVVALSAAFRTKEQISSLSQDSYEARYGGWFGSGLRGEERWNDHWLKSEIDSVLEANNRQNFQRIPRLYFDVGSEDPFFIGNAETHAKLLVAGVRHRFLVREGGHDWKYWRSGMRDAVLHLSAVLTREYGE